MKRFHRRKKLPQKATRRARAAAEVAQQGVEGGGGGGVGGRRLFARCGPSWGRRLGDSSFLLLKIGIPLDFGEKGRKAGLIVVDFDSFFRKLGGHETSFPSSFRPD